MAISDYKFEYSSSGKKNAPMDGISSKKTSRSNSSAGGNLAYIGGNTAAGLGGVFEGIGRLASSTVAKLAGDDRLARYYAKKSYIGEWQSDMAEKYSPGKVTQFFADAGAGVGQSSVFLLNLVAPGAGTVIFGAGVFGNSVGEAVNKTGQLGFKEYAYGGLSAGGELLMEKISGATFKAVGRIGAGVTGSLTKNAVETTATQTAKKGFLKAVASNAVLKDLLKESSGEFVEEFLGDFWDVGISRLTGVDPEASTTLGQAIYSGMVGFASGGLMSGSSMIINRAAAASRGYHINESGNAQQMVRTAEVVLEEAKTAENFQDPAGVVDMLKESVENYNAQKDKTNFASRVALGQMQMFTAYIEKNIGVMQAYTNIMKADAQTLEQYAQLASYYTNEKVTTRDLLNNRDNITTQMAIRDWVNGVLTVDSDLVAEAEVRDFTSTMEGGGSNVNADGTRFSVDGEATAQSPAAAEITQTDFDGEKSVQNVRVSDNMYLSIKKNSDGTYNYAINDKSAKQDANGGVWDKTNVPAEEMRQYYEQAKEGAAQYEAQKAAQTTQETQTGMDGKTTAEGENAAQEQDSTEEKAKEKPRQKSEIDSATEQKLNKMVKGFNTMAYRDRVAVSRMVKSAEANGVDAKTVKKIAIAMTARSGLDIRFTKSISQNGTWTVFKDGSQRRLILLNPDIQSPLEQTFLHEFMHDMMHDQYTNMKAVMDVTSGMLEKGAFDNYVRERRDEYFDACAKAGREGLILTKNEDGTVTRSFASEKTEKAFDLMMREEATANFGAEFLYRRGFLTRIARSNQKLVLRTFRAIGRWINDVRSRDMGTARSLEGYLRTIEDAIRNSKGNSEIASLLFGSNPSAQDTNSTIEKSETRYSLPAVSPVKPSSQEWKPTIDTAEAKKRFPSLWDVTADESQTRNPTQIRSTVSTYRKIYDILKAEGFNGKILDASSGLGYGTRAGIDEYGFEVDDIEPYPDRSYSPKYTDYSALDGKYDAIISNAVLNVLPQDQRDALVVKMGNLLADGGKLYVNVRGDDVNTLSSNPSNVKIGDMEWFVSSTGSYQKGFTRNELVAYLKDALGSDFEVQGTSKFGKASAIVTKKENVGGKSKIGENTRFELKIGNQTTPVKVQETKNLIAIHNLSEQKLLDTLDLGGFPMPSIAVVKADQGHSNYGDISVIFGRDTIDPKMNRTNKLYGSDAYTPTGSSVEYKVNRDAAKQFSRELSALARGIADGEYASDVSHAIDNLGDASSQSLPALIDSMSRRTGFQAAYLQSKGETVQPVYYKKEYSKYGGIEAVKNFIDILGSDAKQICLDVLEGDNSAWESQLENVKKAILDKYNDDPKKRALLERTIVSRYGASQVYDLVGGTWAYLDDLEHGQYGVDTKEVDRLATAQAIEEKIDFDDFRKWLTEKADGILGKKGIRNNKDPFTPSGNRRSFEQLHDDFTIDNIMRDMKKNQQARGQGTFGATAESVAAVATPEYKSISDMKKDSARLKIIDDQAYTQIKDDIGNQIIDIITDIKNANKIKTSNDFFVSDAIGSLIVGGGQLRSADSIIRYFANGGYSIDRNTANRILDVYRAVSAMPTGYFEAKPQRVVNFSEIKMVELPESASDTLKKQLERRKIPYEVYGKTDEDRAKAVKKLNDVRFELDSGTGYSRGQMSKIVANRTKGKVYSQTDAAIAIDNVTALVSEILSDDKASLRAKIRGKSRAEVIDFLFEQMNKEQGDGRLKTALQAADYILNHAVVQEELDSIGREEYARMVDIINGVESYRKKVKFTDTEKADLKHMFDKGYPSLLRAWSNKGGMMPSRILAELKESGVAVDSTSDVESDIFADLISQYQNAKQAVKQWNESVLLNTVGDKRMLTKLKSDMAHEILKAFETTGEKSTYRKEVEARQAYISKFLEDHRTKLNAARKRAMSESRLYRNAIKLDEQLKRDRRSSQLLSDDRMRKIAESAAKIGKPRNARNPLTVWDWAKSMQEIYSPKNPLLAIYGEADEKTGIFEHTYYSNEVGEALNRLTQIDTGKKFLTDEQIVDLDTVVSGITRLYRDYDTVYFQGKRQSLTETAQRGVDNMQWIADERAKKGQRLKIIDKFKRWTDAYLYEIASPMAVIHDMERHDPNGVLSAAFEEVVYGQIGAQTMFANLMDPFETFYKENKGYKKALARETVNFQGHELTKAQAISLYCTMKREHARLGLETFGIVFDDKDGNRVKTGALKGYDAKTLYNSFNETDKRFISLVENFFNDVSKRVKGDADMRILGSTNVLDDYYFPIQRDRSQRTNSVGDTRRGISDFLETVLNLSFNQNTVRHADGRIEISDVTNTIMKHAQGLAIYANLYEQIQTFDRILNKKVGEMDADGKLIRETTKSLGEMMEDNHKGMLNYLSKLLADVQGVRTDMTGAMDVVDHALTKVYGLYAQAAISGNIKTAILPLASYFATGLYVDARHMAKGFAMNASPAEIRTNMEQMDKYSSVTKGRYYDRGAIKSQTVQDEVRGLISVTGKGIEATERFMLSKVWNACKSQTAEQLGLAIDSDENCRAAAKLFDKVVIETQSQYVASMKSAMGRSKNQLIRGLTMFKSDGAAMFSSSFDAIRRFMDLRDRAKSGQDVGKELAVAKKRAGRAVASVASVCVAVAIITQAMRYAFNNDDEEEETPAKNIAMNTMNSAMGMFPLIGDVYSVFAEGYDISNMTLDALNDGINGVRGMVSLFGDKNATQADVARATRKALYGVGHMAGVPVRNLTNLTTGVIRRISKPAMYGYDSIFSGEKYSEDLQRAVKRGDDKMAEAITKVMFRRKKTGAYNQETLDEVLRLYKAGYDKKVMPGGIPDGLTRAQRKTFLNVYGKSDADVQKLIESDAYKAFDDEQKASAINSLYRSWRAYAEYQATGETDDKSALLSEIMGADKFGKARAYLSGLKAKENAETPKDGWRSTIQKGLKGMGLTSDEQALMLYAAGYHSTSDLSAFLRVLNARNLTKEQLALFAAIFKLDVKNGKLVERKTTKKTA
jgi:hypothetical protein